MSITTEKMRAEPMTFGVTGKEIQLTRFTPVLLSPLYLYIWRNRHIGHAVVLCSTKSWCTNLCYSRGYDYENESTFGHEL